MTVMSLRSGVGCGGSSLERCGGALASKGLAVGAADIDREVRSCHDAGGRFLGEASRRCFYFLHVDVTCVGSLRPQTESMQALARWRVCGMFRRALRRCAQSRPELHNWRLRDDRSVYQRIYLAIERRQEGLGELGWCRAGQDGRRAVSR